MKTLLIVRHAKSSRDDPKLSDHDRPLNERGIKDAKRLGKTLTEEGFIPDLILASSAKRAQETAALLIKFSEYHGEFKLTKDLYLTNVDSHIEVVKKNAHDFSVIMIVGHNPTLEEWVNLLADAHEQLTTANLAKIELPIEQWNQLTANTRGRLVKLWQPKE